jgi:hypothetical protein
MCASTNAEGRPEVPDCVTSRRTGAPPRRQPASLLAESQTMSKRRADTGRSCGSIGVLASWILQSPRRSPTGICGCSPRHVAVGESSCPNHRAARVDPHSRFSSVSAAVGALNFATGVS